jgi:hypothetical protein
MPRYREAPELTPFAQVLIEYMWNRRNPTSAPLAAPQLAARLGMPRQNVYNWIYRGTVPTFEIILAVLARLDIPLRELYDAYQRAGLPVPRWDDSGASANVPTTSENPPISRSRRPTALPVEEIERRRSVVIAPAPLPYTPPPPLDPAQDAAEEWDTIIAQTARSLRQAGMPQRMVDGAVAALRARQHNEDPFQRHVIAEHSDSAPGSAPHPAEQQPEKRPAHTSTRKSPNHARK